MCPELGMEMLGAGAAGVLLLHSVGNTSLPPRHRDRKLLCMGLSRVWDSQQGCRE